MQERSKLATAISIVSLLTTAIVAGINTHILPSAAFWAAAVGFLCVSTAFVWPLLLDRLTAQRTRRRSEQIAEVFHPRLVALSTIFSEITSSALDSRGIGSILNTAHTYKSLDAYAVNAYSAHLSTLGSLTACIRKRAVSGELSGISLAKELFDAVREYTRLCDLVAGEIEWQSCDTAIAERAIIREWSEISRQSNSIADEFTGICRAFNLEDPGAHLPVYLGPTRNLNLRTKPTEPNGPIVADRQGTATGGPRPTAPNTV